MTWILVLLCSSGYNQIENALIDWFGFQGVAQCLKITLKSLILQHYERLSNVYFQEQEMY